MSDVLPIARAHRNQFLDAAEDAIAERERLRKRLAEADALLTEAAETASADTVGRIREYLRG